MQQIYVEGFYRSGYHRFMKYVKDYLEHPKNKEIEQRLKIIEFFDEYGADAAQKAFGKSRSTIYLWKCRLKATNGRLSSLAPKSKSPVHKRKRIIHPFILNFIIKYRNQYPGDKTTITPILAKACKEAGIKTVSESTVGRIISDLKKRRLIPSSSKVYIHGQSGKLHSRDLAKRTRKQRRKGYYPQQPGDLVQMDTISIFFDGIKRYIFTAIDLKTRFAFAYAYKTISSSHGRDFLSRFIQVTPFKTSRIQTDNGGEFEKYFHESCQRSSLVHLFNYPKHPQSNGCLERFNRTIQEQFVNSNVYDLEEPSVFNRRLMEYLVWYNTERPHRSIGKVPPLRYYVDTFINPLQSNMLWTLTFPLLLALNSLKFI